LLYAHLLPFGLLAAQEGDVDRFTRSNWSAFIS
jgi:hypothetical protein